MADQFLGEIRIVGFNFAPKGWALCDGQLLSIAQNTALFSLLGTFYGGNGTSTFALPNLQGMAAMDFGSGAGLTPRDIGESSGESTHTLTLNELAAHTHPVNCDKSNATTPSPVAALPAVTTRSTYAPLPGPQQLSASALTLTGGNQPHNNMQPYLVMNYCIALQGIFPSRA
ncbi:MAG TPA: tail fiber protein [Fimbriimonadaceae bacterium]|nr:tail fiber protein [Fimbriimonadaceae bacterium]